MRQNDLLPLCVEVLFSTMAKSIKDALCSLYFSCFKKAFPFLPWDHNVFLLLWLPKSNEVSFSSFKPLNSLKSISVPGLRWTENSIFFHKSLTSGNWVQRGRTNEDTWTVEEQVMSSRGHREHPQTEPPLRHKKTTRTGLTIVNGTPLPCTCVWRGSGFCTGLLCWTNTSNTPLNTGFIWFTP